VALIKCVYSLEHHTNTQALKRTNNLDTLKPTEALAMKFNRQNCQLLLLQQCHHLPFCATLSASWYMPSMK